MIRVPKNADQGEKDREATMLCVCEQAQKEQKRQQDISVIEKRIEKNYEGAPHVQNILKPAVQDVAKGFIDSITVKQEKQSMCFQRRKKD